MRHTLIDQGKTCHPALRGSLLLQGFEYLPGILGHKQSIRSDGQQGKILLDVGLNRFSCSPEYSQADPRFFAGFRYGLDCLFNFRIGQLPHFTQTG